MLQSMGSRRVRHDLVTEQQVIFGGSQAAHAVKNLCANAGDIRDAGLSLGSGEAPEVGNSNSFSLAWRIPRIQEMDKLQSKWSQKVGHN